jgi:acetylornithine deacetylase/succinyl-diaminopimelate desuccinylase-like protein
MRWLALAAAVPILAAAAPPAVDWTKTNPETLRHFSALLKIDTSSPPGNETKAAEYVKGILEQEGIAAKLLAEEPSRANLVARLKGNGKKRPILIMGHTDVVGVQRERWSVDPFGAVRKNGRIYGRGSLDDKDNLTACLMVMLLLKRSGVTLDRDVIFLAEAGEESAMGVGIDYVIAKHWDEIDAEYALAEGGYFSATGGRVRFVEVTTTEKVPRRATLVAKGTAGHGSRPRQDNAVVRLANAVSKVGAWQPPMRLNDTTRTYFERLAQVSDPESAQRYKDLFDSRKSPEVQKYLAANELGHNSILRTSISPTILRAGFRENVIPSQAEAVLDIRALPDEDMPRFFDELRKVIGDPNVEIVPPSGGRPVATPSRLDTEMFRVLESVQKRMFPSASTLPGMLTGATDMAQLRAKGVQAYGIGPALETAEGGLTGAHADDEFINEAALYQFVEYLWNAVTGIAAAK